MLKIKTINCVIVTVIMMASMVLAGGSAFAKNCYESREAEAEQGIRIHSELMVIGLTCQHLATSNGKNLYATYRQFTAAHGDLFGSYETILMNYYRKSGRPNPEAHMNFVRTEFGNKISNDAAKMRPDIFCEKYAPRVIQASAMSGADVRKWAATIYPSHPVSVPLCKK